MLNASTDDTIAQNSEFVNSFSGNSPIKYLDRDLAPTFYSQMGKSDELITDFSKKFTTDMDYIHNEIEKFRKNTAILCLEIEHMTGKLVNEA